MSNLAEVLSLFPVTRPTTSEKPYLLACPFCQQMPTMRRFGKGVRIECKADGCLAKAFVIGEDEATAVSRWNRRA